MTSTVASDGLPEIRKIMWRYNYDLNGNLHLLNPSNRARLTPLRYDLRDRITRLGDVPSTGWMRMGSCAREAPRSSVQLQGLLTRLQ